MVERIQQRIPLLIDLLSKVSLTADDIYQINEEIERIVLDQDLIRFLSKNEKISALTEILREMELKKNKSRVLIMDELLKKDTSIVFIKKRFRRDIDYAKTERYFVTSQKDAVKDLIREAEHLAKQGIEVAPNTVKTDKSEVSPYILIRESEYQEKVEMGEVVPVNELTSLLKLPKRDVKMVIELLIQLGSVKLFKSNVSRRIEVGISGNIDDVIASIAEHLVDIKYVVISSKKNIEGTEIPTYLELLNPEKYTSINEVITRVNEQMVASNQTTLYQEKVFQYLSQLLNIPYISQFKMQISGSKGEIVFIPVVEVPSAISKIFSRVRADLEGSPLGIKYS